ncbi:RsmE family RNA methyltransferase [Bacteroidetes/Chlorobi group bacterium ChocPot_Mid]|nr:MAG: RsmE family RNA methyltransferase [Bacteroidetes/Chlorobi group bacterium ChocPot_Mid]
MECIYVSDFKLGLENFQLEHSYIRHLKALRLTIGQKIMFTNGNGVSGICILNEISKNFYKFITEKYLHDFGELPVKFGLAIGLLSDRNRFEFALEKAVELGVTDFYPLLTKYSEKKSINKERLQSKAISALEQCKRSKLINIHEPIELKKIFSHPEPVEGSHPEPVEGHEPVEGRHPEPVEGCHPEPVEGHELVEGRHPEPVEGRHPELVEGCHPELVEGCHPELVEGHEPVEGCHPELVEGHELVEGRHPELVEGHEPVEGCNSILPDYEKIILADENGDNPDSITSLNSTLCFVGPEGGFCSEEIEMIKKTGKTICWNLGNRRLRAETAGISILSFASLKITSF